MKAFCRFALASLLLICASSFADTTPADFKAHVLDPPGSVGTSITGNPFVVQFSPCFQGELPGGNTADGCFLGINNSGVDWSGVEFAFANTSALHSQPTDCSPAPNSNVFSSPANCTLDTSVGPNGTYFLDFGGGGLIRNTESFYLTETGVDATLFPVGTGTFTAATPEPSSLLLLLTGLPGAGVLLRRVRGTRQNFARHR